MNLLSPSLSSAPSGGEGVRRTGEEAARFMGARREKIGEVFVGNFIGIFVERVLPLNLCSPEGKKPRMARITRITKTEQNLGRLPFVRCPQSARSDAGWFCRGATKPTS